MALLLIVVILFHLYLDTLSTAGFLNKLIIEIFINAIVVPPYAETYFFMKGSIIVDYDYNYYINHTLLLQNTPGNYTTSTPPEPIYYAPTEPITGTYKTVELYYSITSILTFFVLFRTYHFFRVVHTFSMWNTPRATSICRIMNAQANTSFGIRAYLQIKPFISLIFGVCLIILIFGVAEYVFEYYNSTTIQMLDTAGTNGRYFYILILVSQR